MLTHKGTQVLKTERLILRPFEVGDARQMYDNWASDENVTRYLTWLPHESPEATAKLLEEWHDAYSDARTYNWAIELDGQAIGSIGAVKIDDLSEHAEIGYCIGKPYWGRGIMTEAAGAVIEYLFAQVGLNRIGICHAVPNKASGRVAQKCGMKYEGTKREFLKAHDGVFLDVAFLGITRRDWEQRGADGAV